MKNRYPFPELNDLPQDIRQRIVEVQEKSGFIPNVFLAFARRPAEWRAFFAYHDALMLKEQGSLSKGEREMIVTATSAANQCLYCVVAHGALLRIYEKRPLVADQVAVIDGGRIVEEAPAAELFERAVHPYTRALIAAAPDADRMNRLDLAAVAARAAGDMGDDQAPLVEIAPGHRAAIGGRDAQAA